MSQQVGSRIQISTFRNLIDDQLLLPINENEIIVFYLLPTSDCVKILSFISDFNQGEEKMMIGMAPGYSKSKSI